MERDGYPEGYDKNSVYKKDQNIDELNILEERYEGKKKKLMMNLIEFIVGGILLVFCRQYLQQHPAEKVALFTGFEVITQKIQMMFAGDDNALQEKYDLERSFEEVISLAKEGDCLAENTMLQLETRYAALEGLDADTFASQKNAFANYLRSTYMQVKNKCIDQ